MFTTKEPEKKAYYTLVFQSILFSVIQAFKENQFTGWDVYPIEAYDKSGNKLEGYYGLYVEGRCGKIIDSWSPIEECPSPYGFMGPVKIGFYFEPDSWERQ